MAAPHVHDAAAEHPPRRSVGCDGRVLRDADEANGGREAARREVAKPADPPCRQGVPVDAECACREQTEPAREGKTHAGGAGHHGARAATGEDAPAFQEPLHAIPDRGSSDRLCEVLRAAAAQEDHARVLERRRPGVEGVRSVAHRQRVRRDAEGRVVGEAHRVPSLEDRIALASARGRKDGNRTVARGAGEREALGFGRPRFELARAEEQEPAALTRHLLRILDHRHASRTRRLARRAWRRGIVRGSEQIDGHERHGGTQGDG